MAAHSQLSAESLAGARSKQGAAGGSQVRFLWGCGGALEYAGKCAGLCVCVKVLGLCVCLKVLGLCVSQGVGLVCVCQGVVRACVCLWVVLDVWVWARSVGVRCGHGRVA